MNRISLLILAFTLTLFSCTEEKASAPEKKNQATQKHLFITLEKALDTGNFKHIRELVQSGQISEADFQTICQKVIQEKIVNRNEFDDLPELFDACETTKQELATKSEQKIREYQATGDHFDALRYLEYFAERKPTKKELEDTYAELTENARLHLLAIRMVEEHLGQHELFTKAIIQSLAEQYCYDWLTNKQYCSDGKIVYTGLSPRSAYTGIIPCPSDYKYQIVRRMIKEHDLDPGNILRILSMSNTELDPAFVYELDQLAQARKTQTVAE
ncbi:hypothetical protein HQ571_06555 [Candidatus Kuenenbacteria bacterium]|nr:hypothetical protein [Candidatus Kuenenbacteria bacterium]